MNQPQKIAADVWLREVPLEGYNVCSIVVLGGERALVWDTLTHPDDMGPMAPLLQGREPVIVYSHADWDHALGTAGIHNRNLVIGHKACLGRFGGELPQHLEGMRREDSARWRGVELIEPNLCFRETMRLDLGGLEVELSHLPGHTSDSIVAFLPQRGMLLAGDAVESPLPFVNAPEAVEEWVEGLKRWQADERVRTVVPAHGEPGGTSLIAGTIDYLEGLLTGAEPELPLELSPFYQKAHRSNRTKLARN